MVNLCFKAFMRLDLLSGMKYRSLRILRCIPIHPFSAFCMRCATSYEQHTLWLLLLYQLTSFRYASSLFWGIVIYCKYCTVNIQMLKVYSLLNVRHDNHSTLVYRRVVLGFIIIRCLEKFGKYRPGTCFIVLWDNESNMLHVCLLINQLKLKASLFRSRCHDLEYYVSWLLKSLFFWVMIGFLNFSWRIHLLCHGSRD